MAEEDGGSVWGSWVFNLRLAAMFVPEEDGAILSKMAGVPNEDIYLWCRREDPIGHPWLQHDIMYWLQYDVM